MLPETRKVLRYILQDQGTNINILKVNRLKNCVCGTNCQILIKQKLQIANLSVDRYQLNNVNDNLVNFERGAKK